MSWCIVPSEAVTAFVALIGAAMGAAVGAFLTYLYTRQRDHLQLKRDVLRRLMGYRWQLTPGRESSEGAVFTALNEIPVVYAGEKAVEEALDRFQEGVSGGFRAEHLVPLLRAMARSAGIPDRQWKEEFLVRPLSPQPPQRQ